VQSSFICVKNYTDCRELWTDEDFEMIAIEVKSRDPKCTWEIVGIYMAANDMRLAARTGYTGNSTKRNIIGGDLNLPYADWNGNADCNSGTQAFISSLVWESEFTQIVDSPTRDDALLDVYLVRLESSFTASSIVEGLSGHHGVMLEVEWEENCCVPQVEKLVPVYNKTDGLGLQTLRDKYGIWASNGVSVEDIWNNLKEISESIEHFVPHKILRKNPNPEYYSKEVK
jgi:hypothetical protein